MCVLILEQPTPVPSLLNPTPGTPGTPTPSEPEPERIDPELIRGDKARRWDARFAVRENFNLRAFADRFNLTPIGADLFRTKWDEGTQGVMRRAGVVGWDVEFRRKRVEPLPYKRKGGERYR